ncbi:bifunctional adenosylcobinamide kinase/adenosylcobinamide-phosphate guanylyltransferase [Aliikangiella marina]|uniref:Bifunctional adenosylcobalamin biosynthesis protein n=1 Tax=Aliikangiella marina TaxID=1712262 RepID=A0A545TCP2_9GAMM|nr:bifunctional adenosylcobinamide kinase/adenosylcobinamide-phosphate guanylyltransferase [Aliikangiella marina]TQV74993.1 bifunctional adenosylcobinamide kinase/adenosylcobinamide-phosphate guanylyltransferase [Aliikangiella marina]
MIHLILGGARSGKSRFAESQVEHCENNLIYVATATAGDNEMAKRIAMHQERRSDSWKLIEEPLHLSQIIEKHSTVENTLLIECLTLWLSNWLCRGDQHSWQVERTAFIKALHATQAKVIIVSNEVGSGVVPLGELSRDFVDQAGWLNQTLAQVADKVTLVVAGCPVDLTPHQSEASQQNR